jgi:hypothetical protein
VLRPDGTVVYFSGSSSGQNAIYSTTSGIWYVRSGCGGGGVLVMEIVVVRAMAVVSAMVVVDAVVIVGAVVVSGGHWSLTLC